MPLVQSCPQPGDVIGHRKDGRAIYLIAGASPEGDPGTGEPQGGQQQSSSGGGQQQAGEPQQQGGDELAGLKSALEKEREGRKAAEKDAARAKTLEAELQKYREQNQTETERLIDAARREADQKARDELSTQYGQRLVTAEVRAAAGGKLKDPADAVRLLDGGEFIGKDGEPDRKAIDKAIDQLITEKPYLGVDKGAPSFDGGQRNGAGNGGVDFNTELRRRAGRA